MRGLAAGTVLFLVTDSEGSTRLLVAAVTSSSRAKRFAAARRSGWALDRAELLDYANAR